jgi:hypothetical protein
VAVELLTDADPISAPRHRHKFQKWDAVSWGDFHGANTPVIEGDSLRMLTAPCETRDDLPKPVGALDQLSYDSCLPCALPPTAIAPREHRHLFPDRFRIASTVPMHRIQVGRCETPETIVVSDLVRTHISPEHENDPQARLAGR